MSPQDAIDAVDQLTEELAETYELQAELVLAEFEASRTIIGDFKEWACSCGAYFEEPPSGWSRFWHWPSLKEQPHSRQGEAMDELAAAEEEYNTTDDKQQERDEKLATIPTDIGDFLIDWFDIDSTYASIFYYSDASQIPASGEAWLSSNLGTYSGAVGLQSSAADTSRDVLEGMITNTTTYLSNVTDAVSNLVTLALAQEQIYIDALLSLAQDYTSIGGYISAAKELTQAVQDERVIFFDRVSEQGQELVNAVSSVIQVGLLENNLTGIGPGGNWPTPSNVERNPDNPGGATIDDLRTDAQWFKSHVEYWDGIAEEMGTLKTTAESASRLPIKLIDMPHFSAIQSSSLNGLADDLATAVGKGKDAATEMSEALTQTIRNYLNNEASSTAEADAVFNEFFG